MSRIFDLIGSFTIHQLYLPFITILEKSLLNVWKLYKTCVIFVEQKQITMTTLTTQMTIGLKFQVNGKNFTKLVCNRNRFVDVTLVNDLYNVKAYTLKGVNETKVSELNGIFVEDLQKAIITTYNA